MPTMLHEKNTLANAALLSSDAQKFAVLRSWSVSDLFAQAEGLASGGDFAGAAGLYKNWIACNPENEWLHAVYFNYSVVLAKAGDRLGAINATRECIRLKPDYQPPYVNLGRLLEDAGQPRDAIAQWTALTNRLQEVNGESVRNKLMALQQLGRVMESHQLDGPAEEALRQSIDISVAQPEVIQHWLALRQRQCKWPVVLGSAGAKPETLMAAISPLSLANLVDDSMFELARSFKYHKEFIKPVADPRALPVHKPGQRRRASGKLRIGYVSSDLREHAVGFAMTDVFEEHDRAHFEIYAYYCGIDRVDPTRTRIRNSADRWVEINGMSDEQAAAAIAADEVDILIDLNGYTKDARTRVFAHRPAPVAVNWFGFPGTMGTPYHHYIIGDETIIPQGNEIFFSEKVVRLACYQPNDRKRPVSAYRPQRQDEGLPTDALVFCCLNGMQKITPPLFESWMTILKAVPNSVLWLLGGVDETEARVKALAEAGGVAPERLIFAKKKANPDHLARYVLADLFLDTFPYGAHTTAADSLWMGVPILTLRGQSFAARVCASVLSAAGLSDLICPTLEAYVAVAISLGREPAKLTAFKQRLASVRTSSLLFDTPRLTRDLEALYRGMWDDFERGERPVPDLSNLDVYHEIGVEIALEKAGAPFPIEDHRRLYREKLEARHAQAPLAADARLWPGGT